MTNREHVFVAMSGGVDSAVTAAKLLQEGFRVTGIHMETWKDPHWQAASQNLPNPAEAAITIAESLGIEFVSLNVKDSFFTHVVQKFIQQYLAGNTPNPCLFCNPQIKWGILQNYALEQGAHYFATGHYARIEQLKSGRVRLLRGLDSQKDQSYVLSMLSQFQLSKTLLPLGELTKFDVRNYARSTGLHMADQKDSQDLCFLGSVNYRDFLQRFAPDSSESGEIVDMKGVVVGTHQGLAFYTIGQRKGIRVAAPEPYYVFGKDIEKNQLIVGYADQVEKNHLVAGKPNWISGFPPDEDENYSVMVRYRAIPVSARLTSVSPESFRLEFTEPLSGITPGQVAVLFREEECLGGGVIELSG